MGMPSKNPYGATGGGNWGWLGPEEIRELVIAEDDPEHPEHEGHRERTSLDNPEFIQLLEDMRTLRMIGMKDAKPITVYLDGKTPTVAAGRRTVTALRIINKESRAADRLSVRMTTTRDPDLARDLDNANRASDPPMVLAQRYAAAHAVDGNRGAAAARVGLPLAQANILEKCLALPADLRRRINRREIAPDQALRLGKEGAKEAVKKVAAAVDKKTNRVDRAKVAKVAAPRLSTRLARGIGKEMQACEDIPDWAKALFRFMDGDRTALDAHPAARALALRAGWEPAKEAEAEA